jgi:hypothetical protein
MICAPPDDRMAEQNAVRLKDARPEINEQLQVTVLNIQNYRVSGLCSVSYVLNTRKLIVSETGSLPVLR